MPRTATSCPSCADPLIQDTDSGSSQLGVRGTKGDLQNGAQKDWMPLTRKQAWRKVKIRHEPVDIFEGTMVRCKQSLRESRRRYQSGRARDRNRNRNREQSPGRSMSGECRGDTSDVPGKMHVLERWRRPKYVSDSSAARPEISVEKRQAAAPCVRVGSRVSFNTVVAAILIPSARDLHAAARQELWWQETDYRDFRINFVQFMRQPTNTDDPEMVPVDIVAESGPPTDPSDEHIEHIPPATTLQPVIVGAIIYDEAASVPEAAATGTVCDAKEGEGSNDTESERCVRAWKVDPRADNDGGSGDEDRERLSASAAAAAAAAVAAAQAASTDPGMSSVQANHTSADVSKEISNASDVVPTSSDYMVSESSAEDSSECWRDERESDDSCSSWESTRDEEDSDGNAIRVRRSFSNLETARRWGTGVDGEVTSDDTDNEDEEDSTDQQRPRALSLDGWFTYGLENSSTAKSYKTHDHAGRLRELVRLSLGESENCDFTDSIQRLHVELNVRVSDTGGKNVKAGTGENKDEDGGGGGGGGKCSEIIDGFGIGIDGKGNTKCRGPAKQPAGDFGISTASRTISTLAAAATDGTRSSSSLLAAEHAAASRSLDVCVT